ncbi:hypothetical protein [Geodermatophilus sp. FMUSA9-8]|uniref:hypothetical protein n=1 Tax=Geodermatophilus sp. FMUSA9-8 TaxID=3120155 RepID=UPI003008ED33
MQTSQVSPSSPVSPPSPRPRRTERADLLLAGGAAVVAALCFLLVRASLIDDAYITLSYARNLAEEFHWGLTPFRTANSATSPLNVLVLGLAAFVVRDPVWGLGVVFVVLTALQALGLARLARRLDLSRGAAVAATALLLLSPLFLAIVGMEMTLALTLAVWATVAAAERRPVLFGALAALLVLTRVDLAVVPLVLLLATPGLLRRTHVVLGTALLVAAPWYVFSWVALGALVPDTLVIKTVSTGAWGPWDFANGWQLYLERYPAATVLAAIPALAGLLALVVWPFVRRRARWAGLGPVVALGAAGVLHAVAYSLLAPPPFHWYYAPSVGALTVTAAFLGAAAAGRRPAPAADGSPAPVRRRPVALLAAAVAAALLLVDAAFALQRGVPWEMTPITTNWATAEQYLAIGEDLRAEVGDDVVRSPGEIGTLAYACRCDIVDPFSDRGTLLPQIDQRQEEAGTVMRLLLRLNFANLDRPPAAEPDRALVYEGGRPDGDWPVTSAWRGSGSFSLVAP